MSPSHPRLIALSGNGHSIWRCCWLAVALFAVASFLLMSAPASGQRRSDEQSQIVDQATYHSEIMAIAEYLDDVIGSRLTNSPSMRAAEQWTQGKFKEWGLVNVHKEGYEFGRGWWNESSFVRMVSPRQLTLTSIPIAWTPPTAGTITVPVIVAPMSDEADFSEWHGRLAGKAVMVSQPRLAPDQETPLFVRRTDADLQHDAEFVFPAEDINAKRKAIVNLDFLRKLEAFVSQEHGAVIVFMSRRDGKLVSGEGYRYEREDTSSLPEVELAQEDYLRLVRLANRGSTTILEINSNVHFDDTDSRAYNILADIQGTNAKAGYVMAGAHLDSWVAADGATDDGAGVTVVMEVARMLKQMNVRPRRTIRFVLWSGEEQGLRGSLAYVEQHLARRGGTDADMGIGLAHMFNWPERWPIQPLPGFGELKAYFNIDHGAGKIRGLFAERNPALVPIFRQWLSPFESTGSANVFINDGGTGTDHYPIQSIGLPGFGFLQDQLDYSRTVHSNLDTFDHLKIDDMRQSSMVLAWLLLCAASAKDDLPGSPSPTLPHTSGMTYQAETVN
jgi:carboxypeptidase Q